MTDAVAQRLLVLNPDARPSLRIASPSSTTGTVIEEVQATGFRERVFHPDDIARLHETRLRASRYAAVEKSSACAERIVNTDGFSFNITSHR